MKQGLLIGIIFIILILFWIGWGVYSSSTAQKTPYSLLKILDNSVEIRQYEEQTVITTYAADDSKAFSPLGNYIFGGNEENKQISMTAPVVTTDSGGRIEMSFILPKEYTTDNAPKAQSDKVKISSVSGRKIATIRFSGFTTIEKVKKKEQELLQILKENSIEIQGSPMLFRYNDPYTPPFMRRNEIGIEVKWI